MAKPPRLKLRARDLEDMQVIASLLQDALVPVMDVTYLKRDKRFVLVANRFDWRQAPEDASGQAAAAGAAAVQAEGAPPKEDARFEDAEAPPPFARVNCGVCFDKVERVRFRNLRPDAKDEILNLLTVTAEPKIITLLFSDDRAIRLDVGAIRCHFEDIGEPWPTRWRPEHAPE